MRTMNNKYDDMLYLSRPVSTERHHMSNLERAAQFAPFQALTGYEGAIKETARFTTVKIELDEDRKTILDRKQHFLADYIEEQPEVTVTYFLSDEKKYGGAYITVTGIVKRFDSYEHVMILANGTKISLNDILDIESDWFYRDIFRET